MLGVPNLRITPLAARIAAARGIDVSRVRGSGFEGKVVAADLERGYGGGGDDAAARKAVAVGVGGGNEGEASLAPTVARGEGGALRALDSGPVPGMTERGGFLDEAAVIAGALRGVAERAAQGARTAALATQYVEADVTALVSLLEGKGRSLADCYVKASLVCARGEALSGAKISFSDMGGAGVLAFTPQITPPAVAALGIGAPYKRLVMTDVGIENRWFVMQAFAFDRRTVGEAEAAAFQQRLRGLVESPESIAE